uniref:Heterodimeric geranylgeranyl pyrophosphate synthase small subunit, chloroplastic n=1 Tax=Anthurium amnicola TaxID=1678845 RepID=A0A1D1YF90_9ARAE
MATSAPAGLFFFFSPVVSSSVPKVSPLFSPLHIRSPAQRHPQRCYLCSSPSSPTGRSSFDSSAHQSSSAPQGSAFDLRSYWSAVISQIDAELDVAVPVRYPLRIHEAMRYSVLAPGAKRAPPVMCLAVACELLGAPRAAALPTACALEMVHTASLVHDDLPCMDAAQLRRGRPTSHTVFGVDMAVLAGDALFPLGFRHIVSHTPPELVPEERVLRVVEEIARAVGSGGMAAGQFLDLESTGTADGDVMTVLEKKFGEMAECSAVCGGLVGGAGAADLGSLRRYGRAVGVLYQVVDDILMEDGNGSGGDGKMGSKASVVRVHGMGRAMAIAEELREQAKRELRALEGNYGIERLLPLHSFVDYAVERSFDAATTGSSGSGPTS